MALYYTVQLVLNYLFHTQKAAQISPLFRYTTIENFQNQLEMLEFNWH